MELFDRAKTWIAKITELGLLLVALGIVLQCCSAATSPSSATSSVTC